MHLIHTQSAQSAKMWSLATDVAWPVCLNACLLHTTFSHKTAEPIAVPFCMRIRVGPRNYVLGRCSDPP